ncbi:MAG: iron complex outermembrane receptor protein [Bermanella sp.]
MKSKILLLAIACSASYPLLAQVAASASARSENLALEEVVVTAQKKAESLQDTPISLTAFGEERLEKEVFQI